MAVTRHELSFGSITVDSITVLGIETSNSSSQLHFGELSENIDA